MATTKIRPTKKNHEFTKKIISVEPSGVFDSHKRFMPKGRDFLPKPKKNDCRKRTKNGIKGQKSGFPRPKQKKITDILVKRLSQQRPEQSKVFMKDYPSENVRDINAMTNKLLLEYDNLSKNLAINPAVDINKIAKAVGVKEIKYVTLNHLGRKHPLFKDGIVTIDENHSSGQRVFDLAHVVGHITVNHLTPGEQKMETFLDRFAANLLVPISRFQLWENRTNKEIADAFHVDESCIKKRREEIKHELSILTSNMKPCPIEDIVDPDVVLDIDAILKGSAIIDENRC